MRHYCALNFRGLTSFACLSFSFKVFFNSSIDKSDLSIEELKYMAKVKGIKGYTKMDKEELIKNLED